MGIELGDGVARARIPKTPEGKANHADLRLSGKNATNAIRHREDLITHVIQSNRKYKENTGLFRKVALDEAMTLELVRMTHSISV